MGEIDETAETEQADAESTEQADGADAEQAATDESAVDGAA